MKVGLVSLALTVQELLSVSYFILIYIVIVDKDLKEFEVRIA